MRAAALLPAAQFALGGDFLAELQRIAQGGRDIVLAASRRGGVAEMGLIVRHDVGDLIGGKSPQTLAQAGDEQHARHDASPSIFSTEAMKLFHSSRWAERVLRPASVKR